MVDNEITYPRLHTYLVLVRNEYTKDTKVYNRPGLPTEDESGWEVASLSPFLGAYQAYSMEDALRIASVDSGFVQDALIVLV